MKRCLALTILALAVLSGCQEGDSHAPSADHARGHAAGHSDAHEGGEDHGHAPGAVSVTHFTGKTELFVEYPHLAVGGESAFAAHFTWLKDFKPVTEGKVTVTLHGGGKPDETFEVAAPSSPGIFRPVARPRHAGERLLSLKLESGGDSILHELGQAVVHPTVANAEAAATDDAEDPGEISFLKEQQWVVDFMVEPVQMRTLRPSVRANATIRVPANRDVVVSATTAGVLAARQELPRVGQVVEAGQIVALVIPRLGGDMDVASLELAVRTARIEAEHASHERERLEKLFETGAIAERRLIEARQAELRTSAELETAQRRLAQQSGADGGVALRAPISGTVAELHVGRGSGVDAGQPLLRVVNLDRLWLEARVPESEIGKLAKPSGAWFRVSGFEDSVELHVGTNARLESFGAVVDPTSRTVAVVFEFPNPDRRFRAGLSATANLFTGAGPQKPALPSSAVIEDGGQPVVFVQTGGESFVRRVVEVGIRDAEYVEVVRGVQPGERVVSRGAHHVRLQSIAPAAVGHGHAH